MCDDADDYVEGREYRYLLYRFDRPDLRGSIELTVNADGLMVEDGTTGKTTERFLGRDSHEYTVSLTKEKAIKVLEAYGIRPGHFPTETLALRFAERYKGCDSAASKFREMAEEAGVEPKVFVW